MGRWGCCHRNREPDPSVGVLTDPGADLSSNLGLFPPDGGQWGDVGQGLGPGWEGQEEFLGVLHLPLAGGVFPSTPLQRSGQAEFGSTFPLRGDGMLEPEGSEAAGLGRGGLADPLEPPQLPGDWGRGRRPTLACRLINWALGLEAVGKAPPGLKAASPALA